MDLIAIQNILDQILQWITIGVAINAVALLCIMVSVIALTLHVTRATREITRGITSIAQMTQEVLRRTEP